MKSVGEAMAIGRSFPEALQKALRSLERKEAPFSFPKELQAGVKDTLFRTIKVPTEYRLKDVQQCLWHGGSVEEVLRPPKLISGICIRLR